MALVHRPNNDPAASPLLTDLSRLPPLFITATTTEVLLDNSLLLTLQATRRASP
jgi:monoterpene epsilon-lactone hydrolase